MERVNRIIRHPLYREAFDKTQKAEKKRRYCHHDMAHFLDVARISMILALREEAGLGQEIIYAAALLHDIGRYRQYEDGIEHQEAGAALAREILPQCGFDDKETDVIVCAVLGHRSGAETADGLCGILTRADRLSRPCYACKVRGECYWSEEKKNTEIRI